MFRRRLALLVPLVLTGITLWFLPLAVRAHCDTLDGPVVQAARLALEKADLTPVLKWVKSEYEQEVREAFQHTLAVRQQGPEASRLADRYFFETVVRVHRQGEGAPYTGLKPAGTEVGAAIPAADAALQIGSADALLEGMTDELARQLRARFLHALETKQHADESVAKGREFVEAYVEFIHFVEQLHETITSEAGHGTAAVPASHEHRE